jgi:molecular chaperone GrpE (heat shock protein)
MCGIGRGSENKVNLRDSRDAGGVAPGEVPSVGQPAAKMEEPQADRKPGTAPLHGSATTLASQDEKLRTSKPDETAGALERTFARMAEELAAMRQELQRLKTDDSVLTSLHKRCQELSEEHHERDTLRPVFHTLIGIADRSRQQTARYRRTLKMHSTLGDDSIGLVLSQLTEARNADRIEIEGLLANYAVEPFLNPSDVFDPSTQKCIQRVECHDPALEGRIAQRILPGYRRDGRILRLEYVSVHVRESKQQNPSQGDKR